MPVALVGASRSWSPAWASPGCAWSSSGPTVELTVLAVVVGHLAWAIALAVAFLRRAVWRGHGDHAVHGGASRPSAWVWSLLRAGAHPMGEAVVAPGPCFSLPTPAAWLVAGALWTGIGLWQLRRSAVWATGRGPCPVRQAPGQPPAGPPPRPGSVIAAGSSSRSSSSAAIPRSSASSRIVRPDLKASLASFAASS